MSNKLLNTLYNLILRKIIIIYSIGVYILILYLKNFNLLVITEHYISNTSYFIIILLFINLIYVIILSYGSYSGKSPIKTLDKKEIDNLEKNIDKLNKTNKNNYNKINEEISKLNTSSEFKKLGRDCIIIIIIVVINITMIL